MQTLLVTVKMTRTVKTTIIYKVVQYGDVFEDGTQWDYLSREYQEE